MSLFPCCDLKSCGAHLHPCSKLSYPSKYVVANVIPIVICALAAIVLIGVILASIGVHGPGVNAFIHLSANERLGIGIGAALVFYLSGIYTIARYRQALQKEQEEKEKARQDVTYLMTPQEKEEHLHKQADAHAELQALFPTQGKRVKGSVQIEYGWNIAIFSFAKRATVGDLNRWCKYRFEKEKEPGNFFFARQEDQGDVINNRLVDTVRLVDIATINPLIPKNGPSANLVAHFVI